MNLMNQEMMTMMINMRAEITALHTTHQETHNNLIKIEKFPPIYPGGTLYNEVGMVIQKAVEEVALPHQEVVEHPLYKTTHAQHGDTQCPLQVQYNTTLLE